MTREGHVFPSNTARVRHAAADPLRFGPATLIEAGTQKILVDAGRGATMRLFQLGIPIGSIDLLLLTHFHSDHLVGLPDIWLTGWLGGKFGRRAFPMRVLGPEGTLHLTHHLGKAFSSDIAIRVAEKSCPLMAYASTLENLPPTVSFMIAMVLASPASRSIMVTWSNPPSGIGSTMQEGRSCCPEIRAIAKTLSLTPRASTSLSTRSR